MSCGWIELQVSCIFTLTKKFRFQDSTDGDSKVALLAAFGYETSHLSADQHAEFKTIRHDEEISNSLDLGGCGEDVAYP